MPARSSPLAVLIACACVALGGCARLQGGSGPSQEMVDNTPECANPVILRLMTHELLMHQALPITWAGGQPVAYEKGISLAPALMQVDPRLPGMATMATEEDAKTLSGKVPTFQAPHANNRPKPIAKHALAQRQAASARRQALDKIASQTPADGIVLVPLELDIAKSYASPIVRNRLATHAWMRYSQSAHGQKWLDLRSQDPRFDSFEKAQISAINREDASLTLATLRQGTPASQIRPIVSGQHPLLPDGSPTEVGMLVFDYQTREAGWVVNSYRLKRTEQSTLQANERISSMVSGDVKGIAGSLNEMDHDAVVPMRRCQARVHMLPRHYGGPGFHFQVRYLIKGRDGQPITDIRADNAAPAIQTWLVGPAGLIAPKALRQLDHEQLMVANDDTAWNGKAK